MKAYEELTEHGKKLRLRKVIEEGLKQYDLEIQTYSFFEEATNMLYKLVAKDGTKFMLKIFDELSSTLEDNLVEAFMIDACRDGSDVPVPEVIPASNGDEVISVESKYTQKPKRLIIYKWLEGIELDSHETNDDFYAVGQQMAKLHIATEGLEVPGHINPKRFDKVYYFKDEKAVYHEDKYKAFCSDVYMEMMDTIVPFVDEYLADLFKKDGMQLIHGDMNPWNLMKNGNVVSVIDFEDSSYGYAIQDLAITLFYYKYDENFDYHVVKEMLLEGYASVRALPSFTEYDLELIMIARRLNFLNYILLVSDDPKEYIETNLKRVTDALKALGLEFPYMERMS